jgi:hypothetical protein
MLAKCILESLDDQGEASAEQMEEAWFEEADRRWDEYKTGKRAVKDAQAVSRDLTDRSQ